MKNALQLLLIMLITTSAAGQVSTETDEDQIKNLIINMFDDIFSDLDPQALEIYCTEDFLLLETGEVWDMEKMKNALTQARENKPQVKRINSFDFITIEVEGNMAWVAYHNKAELKSGDKVVKELNWLESANAILTEKGWKLQLLHSTVAKEDTVNSGQ